MNQKLRTVPQQVSEIVESDLADHRKVEALTSLIMRERVLAVAVYKREAMEEAWERGESITLPPVVSLPVESYWWPDSM